jgi:hypothetical protein
VVFVARALNPDPLWARLAFVVVGALVQSRWRARWPFPRRPPRVWRRGAAGAAPLWAYYSLVPYQEGLTALFLLLGAEALARDKAPGPLCGWG